MEKYGTKGHGMVSHLLLRTNSDNEIRVIPLCSELQFGMFLNTKMCCFGAERQNSSVLNVQFRLPVKNRMLHDIRSGNWP